MMMMMVRWSYEHAKMYPGLTYGRLWPSTQKNGCSDHIQGETLFQTRQDQERGITGPASLLHG